MWRPVEGNWYIVFSATGTWTVTQWGLPRDVPVPADYDGDGETDLAVWRPVEGNWYIVFSATGTWTRTQWGLPGDAGVRLRRRWQDGPRRLAPGRGWQRTAIFPIASFWRILIVALLKSKHEPRISAVNRINAVGETRDHIVFDYGCFQAFRDKTTLQK